MPTQDPTPSAVPEPSEPDEIIAEELSADELNVVSGGGNPEYNCT